MAEKTLNFEAAMKRLEELVTALERGDTPLEEALQLFEEGTKLSKQCAQLLDKAEQKVTKLSEAASADEMEVRPPEEGEGDQ